VLADAVKSRVWRRAAIDGSSLETLAMQQVEGSSPFSRLSKSPTIARCRDLARPTNRGRNKRRIAARLSARRSGINNRDKRSDSLGQTRPAVAAKRYAPADQKHQDHGRAGSDRRVSPSEAGALRWP
jgi:hypothetical protein